MTYRCSSCGLVISGQILAFAETRNSHFAKTGRESCAKYTKGFEAFKANRSLEWQKHIGHVEFELEFNGATFEFTVSPVHATILWYFQEKGMTICKKGRDLHHCL